VPRFPRVHADNAIYHTIARGNNKQDVFLSVDAGMPDQPVKGATTKSVETILDRLLSIVAQLLTFL
jgi:hypothetical protein